jgi:Mg-chelatase subunit ChlD
MIDNEQEYRANARGVSQVVGYILLLAIVITGSIGVLVVGAPAIETVTEEQDERQASIVLQHMDSKFASLSTSGGKSQAEIDLSSTSPRSYTLDRSGWLNVTVNDDTACAANMTLSSVRFADGATTMGYEGGGVWRKQGSGSAMVTAPALQYRDGSINIRLVNLTGSFDRGYSEARLRKESSRNRTFWVRQRLNAGDCVRPNNVTIAVQSDFYQAWGTYLTQEFETTAEVYRSNQTAIIRLNETDLPRRVDVDRNRVINLTSNNYNDVTLTGESIKVDKGVNNTYRVSARPLQNGTMQIGNITSVEADSEIRRQPLDVMFVIDESGSMSRNDGDTTTRSEEAQAASKAFVADLNASRDRAGVISYNDGDGIYRITDNNRYITSNFGTASASTGLNETIEDIPARGGTETQNGVRKANNVFSMKSDESRNKVMVLLTDGVNNDCQDWGDNTDNNDPFDCGGPSPTDNELTVEYAKNAAGDDVTIYTIGYGDSSAIDQALLKRVATVSGGEFYRADDADELNDIFDEIRRSIASTQIIARDPISSNITANGTVHTPAVPGDDNQVAQVKINGQVFHNINDPSTDSQYSHVFAINGGDNVSVKAHDYECKDGAYATSGIIREFNDTRYRVARCTDIASHTAIEPTRVYTSGDDITGLVTRNYNSTWQDNITSYFEQYDNIGVANESGNYILDLKSNQAVVYYDLPNGDKSENMLVLLFQVGVAESDAEAAGVVNVEVTNAHVSG